MRHRRCPEEDFKGHAHHCGRIDALSPASRHVHEVPRSDRICRDGSAARHCCTKRSAERCASLFGPGLGRQGIGNLPCALPTQLRRGDVAVGRPRPGTHLPVIGRMQVTRSFKVLTYDYGVLIVLVDAGGSRRCSCARSDLSCDS